MLASGVPPSQILSMLALRRSPFALGQAFTSSFVGLSYRDTSLDASTASKERRSRIEQYRAARADVDARLLRLDLERAIREQQALQCRMRRAEVRRLKRRERAARVVQRYCRGALVRWQLQRTRAAASLLQRVLRGWIVRHVRRNERQRLAKYAIVIQRAARLHLPGRRQRRLQTVGGRRVALHCTLAPLTNVLLRAGYRLLLVVRAVPLHAPGMLPLMPCTAVGCVPATEAPAHPRGAPTLLAAASRHYCHPSGIPWQQVRTLLRPKLQHYSLPCTCRARRWLRLERQPAGAHGPVEEMLRVPARSPTMGAPSPGAGHADALLSLASFFSDGPGPAGRRRASVSSTASGQANPGAAAGAVEAAVGTQQHWCAPAPVSSPKAAPKCCIHRETFMSTHMGDGLHMKVGAELKVDSLFGDIMPALRAQLARRRAAGSREQLTQRQTAFSIGRAAPRITFVMDEGGYPSGVSLPSAPAARAPPPAAALGIADADSGVAAVATPERDDDQAAAHAHTVTPAAMVSDGMQQPTAALRVQVSRPSRLPPPPPPPPRSPPRIALDASTMSESSADDLSDMDVASPRAFAGRRLRQRRNAHVVRSTASSMLEREAPERASGLQAALARRSTQSEPRLPDALPPAELARLQARHSRADRPAGGTNG